MSFIWPWMLLLLILIPITIGVYIWLRRKGRRSSEVFGTLAAAHTGTGITVGERRHIPPAFFLVGLSLLIFSTARPQMTINLPRVEGTVILAFDVSNSMNAEDLEPSRIDAAKEAAKTFIESQPPTILIGVVSFSNGGFIIQRPTNDKEAILTAIDRLSPEGGTSLGQGIFTSLNAAAGEPIAIDLSSLDQDTERPQIEDFSSTVIVLLTDGENTVSQDPLEVAQLAADAGVRIYPVGIGSSKGSVLEIDGFNILSQLDEISLQQIANLTNGTYYNAHEESSFEEIYENVNLQLTISGEKMEITAVIAGFGLILFIMGGLISLIWFGRAP